MIPRPPVSTRTTYSFPTPRSSDLPVFLPLGPPDGAGDPEQDSQHREHDGRDEPPDPAEGEEHLPSVAAVVVQRRASGLQPRDRHAERRRSEEHTSELQSLMRI